MEPLEKLQAELRLERPPVRLSNAGVMEAAQFPVGTGRAARASGWKVCAQGGRSTVADTPWDDDLSGTDASDAGCPEVATVLTEAAEEGTGAESSDDAHFCNSTMTTSGQTFQTLLPWSLVSTEAVQRRSFGCINPMTWETGLAKLELDESDHVVSRSSVWKSVVPWTFARRWILSLCTLDPSAAWPRGLSYDGHHGRAMPCGIQ